MTLPANAQLLARQREGSLDGVERRRLNELMDLYRRGMVQKAQALKVAVDRGLQRAGIHRGTDRIWPGLSNALPCGIASI